MSEQTVDVETVAYQVASRVRYRHPWGASPCEEQFPGQPSRWCSNCLIAALHAELERLQKALDERRSQ